MPTALPAEFPEATKGTYVLILSLPAAVSLSIGKLGIAGFAAGWYTYVGSAFGPGGLRGRLRHHLSAIKKAHWHIDYLRQAAAIEAVWYLAGEESAEHKWAAALQALPGAQIPVGRFGASDCQCQSHLYFFPARPDLKMFQAHTTDDVQCWSP